MSFPTLLLSFCVSSMCTSLSVPRRDELSLARRHTNVLLLPSFLLRAAMAMSVATFVSYSLPLLHRESFRLRPELAIPVIHLLDNFIGPITDFPYAVSNTIEGLISLDRLQHCFFSPVLQQLPALLLPPLPPTSQTLHKQQQQPSAAARDSNSRRRGEDAARETPGGSETRRIDAAADTSYSPRGRQASARTAAGETAERDRQPLHANGERQAAEDAEAEDQADTRGEIEDAREGDDQEGREEETAPPIPPDIAREAQMLLDVLAASPTTEVYFSHASFAWLPHTLSPFSSIANLATQAPAVYCRSNGRGGKGEDEGEKNTKNSKQPAPSSAAGARPAITGAAGPASSQTRAVPAGIGALSLSRHDGRHGPGAFLRPSLLAILPADAATLQAASYLAQGQATAAAAAPRSSSVSVPGATMVAGARVTAAIDNVSLHISRGELLLVTGVPGSGKSSLLHAILQQRELLLLSGCSFVRSAFCIDFPGNQNGFSAAAGGGPCTRKIEKEVQEPPQEGRRQQRRQQQKVNANFEHGNQQQHVTTRDSLKGRGLSTPLATPSETSSRSSKADTEEAEGQDDEELEALLLHAEIDAAAPIGYVSQEPWLQVGTVRENIMFGCASDEELYEEVIDAFDLRQDISTWPGGDSRFIDEGGADLSGGQRMRLAMARAVYVCLAYRRSAAAHAATVRQQLKWRERQLEQQLRAVVAAAGRPAEWAAEKTLQQQLQLDKERRQKQEVGGMQCEDEQKQGEQLQHKREDAAVETSRETAAHAETERQAATAESDTGKEKHREKDQNDRAVEQQPQEEEGRTGTTTAGVRRRGPAAATSVDGNSGGDSEQREIAAAKEGAAAGLETRVATAESREGTREHSADMESGKKALQAAEEKGKEGEEETGGEDVEAVEELTLPFLFCFDEAFSSLDPGVAERVFRNLFGRSGLLRDAAVVLATSEQSLLTLVSNVYLDETEEDLMKQPGRTQQQPREQAKKLAEQEREEAKEPKQQRQQTQEEKLQQQAKETQEAEQQRQQHGNGGGGAAGAAGGQRMKMSVCYIDKGRVIWKGGVEAFQGHTITRALQQPVGAAAAAAADAETPVAAAERTPAVAAAETLEREWTTGPPGSPLSPRSAAAADEEAAAAEVAAEVTAGSTIESVLSFLPMQSVEEAEAETAADENEGKDEASRKRAVGKEEADELLKNMMVHEQAASGQVGWPSYKWYLRATGIFLTLLFVCLLLLTAFTDFASDVWIAQWTGLSPSARRTRAAKNVATRKEPPNVEGPVGLLGEERKMREAETQAAGALAGHGQDLQTEKKPFVAPAEKDARATHAHYLWFYVGLATGNIFLELLIKLVETRGSLVAAERVHDKLLHVICNAPLWFYDQNPIGRIVNRLSTDVAVLDSGIFKRMGLALTAFFSCVFALLVLGITTVWTLPLLPFLLLGVYFLVFRYYRSTCRELQRASLISFSPLCSSFSESLSGREVIFALRREKLFAARNVQQVELAQRAKLMHWALSAWASIRLQLLSFPLALVNAVGPRLVASPLPHVQQQDVLQGGAGGAGGDFFSMVKQQQRSRQQRLGYLGLAVSYSLSIASALRRMMHHFTHLEKEMCSVERIHDYAVEAEPPALRRLAEVAVQPTSLAFRAAVPFAGEQEKAIATEGQEARSRGEEEKEAEEAIGGLLVAESAALQREEAEAARAAIPRVTRDEEEEEEEEETARGLPARRGVVLDGVEVRYRRAGFQYISEVREAVELELQRLRTARLQKQQQQDKQKLREHPAVASTIDERVALLLHGPGTTAAADADEQQSNEERLLLILEGLGEGEQATFLPPSLRINYAAAGPTEHVGVVGRTGSGKTTLLQTLSGVLRCWRGSVKLDGMDLILFPPEVLREIIGVLPQRPIIFSGMTVRDVVDPRGRYDDEAVWKALDRVGISRLIKSLASRNQLYTPVRATDAAALQLPAERITSNRSGRSGGSGSSRSSSGNSLSALVTTWGGQEASRSGEETRLAEGVLEREKQRGNSLQYTSSPRVLYQPLTACQLRYLALARLILQAPTCRLLLVDEPPADALEEAHDASSRTHTDARSEEERFRTPARAAAPARVASAARPNTPLSSSSMSRSATLPESEQQTASREGSAASAGRPAGTGGRRQQHRLLFTPIPELLKRLFAHCTVFIVAHHVDSLQACDKVWLMWRGRIIGQCKPADIRTDKQLADAMRKAVHSWRAARKREASAKTK